MIGFTAQFNGVDETLRHLSRVENTLDDKMRIFCEKLAEIGVNFMNVGFRVAVYDGDNDARVQNPEWVNENILEIPVTGNSVAFIEFGTGVHYPDTHPRAAAMGAIRGEFGAKKGRNDTWKYYGNPGSMGWYQTSKERAKGLVTTHGNPANSVMYESAKQMRMRILDTARSVFAND